VSNNGHDAKLRKEAERRLKEQTSSRADTLPPQELVEELRVNQIELEMQTDELGRTSRALEVSLDAFADLFEHAPIAYVSVDAGLRLARTNRAARRLLGKRPSPCSALSLVPRADSEKFGTWLRAVSRDTSTIDQTILAESASRRQVQAHARRLPSGDILMALVDVTDQLEAVRALKDRERDLRRLTDLAPDVVCVVSDGVVVYANEAFEKLVDHERTKIQGSPVYDYVHPEDRAQLALFLQRTAHAVPQPPVRFVDGARAERPLELRAMRFVFAGQPSVLLIGRDLTERRRLQARVEQAERLATVGMLVAGVAHEVNNPLAYTIANLEVIGRRLEELDEPEMAEAAADALAGAGRVKAIVGDLRAFNRIDDTWSVVEPNRMVMHAVRMAESQVVKRARLRRDLGRLENLHANENRLVQVVLNLVVNAAQAMPEPDPTNNWVRVRTWQVDQEVCIAVEDNGPGIAAEDQARIFDPFFTTRRGEGGTGLGLAICNSLVQQMGGFIELDSTVGKGTRFVVHLPSVNQAAAPAPLPSRRNRLTRGSKLQILAIDDERALIRSIKRLLSDIAEVTAANSGREAIELMSDGGTSFDLILCDLVMVDGTGEDVGDWLADARPDLAQRLVYMTGMAHPEVRDNLGAPLLTKPFTREALEETIARIAHPHSLPPAASGD